MHKFDWVGAPADLRLLSNDVHVWRASLEQPAQQVQQLAQTLSDDERIRAERFYFERDRKRFIVGRGLLRIILAQYLAIEPHQLQFSYGKRGKPALATTGVYSNLQFNLSHSEELALYAIALERQVGIDLEYIRPTSDVEQLSKRFFCPREYEVIRSLPPKQKQTAFFHGWTCKEAYLKATGEGLTELQQVEVSLAIGEPAKLLRIAEDSQAAANWSLLKLFPAPGYMGALAVEGHDWRLSCWDWVIGNR
jgi:4'-phosphopantetheinyl transferase